MINVVGVGTDRLDSLSSDLNTEVLVGEIREVIALIDHADGEDLSSRQTARAILIGKLTELAGEDLPDLLGISMDSLYQYVDADVALPYDFPKNVLEDIDELLQLYQPLEVEPEVNYEVPVEVVEDVAGITEQVEVEVVREISRPKLSRKCTAVLAILEEAGMPAEFLEYVQGILVKVESVLNLEKIDSLKPYDVARIFRNPIEAPDLTNYKGGLMAFIINLIQQIDTRNIDVCDRYNGYVRALDEHLGVFCETLFMRLFEYEGGAGGSNLNLACRNVFVANGIQQREHKKLTACVDEALFLEVLLSEIVDRRVDVRRRRNDLMNRFKEVDPCEVISDMFESFPSDVDRRRLQEIYVEPDPLPNDLVDYVQASRSYLAGDKISGGDAFALPPSSARAEVKHVLRGYKTTSKSLAKRYEVAFKVALRELVQAAALVPVDESAFPNKLEDAMAKFKRAFNLHYCSYASAEQHARLFSNSAVIADMISRRLH